MGLEGWLEVSVQGEWRVGEKEKEVGSGGRRVTSVSALRSCTLTTKRLL
jgi:hypothetical protein